MPTVKFSKSVSYKIRTNFRNKNRKVSLPKSNLNNCESLLRMQWHVIRNRLFVITAIICTSQNIHSECF